MLGSKKLIFRNFLNKLKFLVKFVAKKWILLPISFTKMYTIIMN